MASGMTESQISFSIAESNDVSELESQLTENLRKLKKIWRRKVTHGRSVHYCYEDGRRKKWKKSWSGPTRRLTEDVDVGKYIHRFLTLHSRGTVFDGSVI